MNANIYRDSSFGVYLDRMKIEIHPNYLVLKYIDLSQMDFLVHLHKKKALWWNSKSWEGIFSYFLKYSCFGVGFSYTVKGSHNF